MTPRASRFRAPFVLAALFSLGLSSSTQGADRTDRHQAAALTISIHSGGKANYSFMLSTATPPSDTQRRLIETFLGAPLTLHQYRASDGYDDESENDNDDSDPTGEPATPQRPAVTSKTPARATGKTPPSPATNPLSDASTAKRVFLTAVWSKELRLEGMQVQEQIDARGLLATIAPLGIDRLSISVSHPKTGFSDCTQAAPSPADFLAAYTQGESHYYLISNETGASQPSLIHIRYGYTRRMLATRGLTVGLFFLIPIFLVVWKRISVSRSEGSNGPADRFAAIRLLNLTSIGLPATWWILQGLTGVKDLTKFLEAGYSRSLQAEIETAVYILPPLLCIGICALILGPMLKLAEEQGSPKHRQAKGAGHLILGVCLPFLLWMACLAELVQGRFALAAGFVLAAQLVRLLDRSSRSGVGGLKAHALVVTPLRERVLELASRAGVRLGQIFVIPTNEARMANAFATSSNNVLLCEYLLRQLNRREVDGVVAHEISHLRLHHPRIKRIVTWGSILLPVVISVLLPLAGSTLMLMTRAPMFLSAYTLMRNQTDFVYGGGVLLAILMSLVFSRRFEYSADALAVTITRDPEAMITALVKLARLNLLPVSWSRFDENMLTHPSTMNRVRAIARQYGVSQERLRMLIDNPDTGQESYSLNDTSPVTAASSPWPATPAPRQPHQGSEQARGSVSAPGRSQWSSPSMPPRALAQKKSRPIILVPVQVALMTMLLCFVVTLPGQSGGRLLSSYGIPVPLAVVVAGVLGLMLGSHLIKLKVLRVMPRKMSFVPTRMNAYPGLDRMTVARYTDELTGLGFNTAVEYTPEYENKKFEGFSRLLVNPAQRCFAEVNQVLAGEIPVTPVHCVITSYLEARWSISTTNAEPLAVSWANRLPKSLGCCRQGWTPAQLLREHLSQRNYITSELGRAVSNDMSVQFYLVRQGENSLERRARLKRMSAVLYLLRIDIFKLRPKTDWLGRLGKRRLLSGNYDLELQRSGSSNFTPRPGPGRW